MSDKTRVFPYTAWRLTPSLKPAEVELVRIHSQWNGGEWHISSRGKYFSVTDLYETRAAAIAGGMDSLTAQEAKLRKMQAAVDKKRIALTREALK